MFLYDKLGIWMWMFDGKYHLLDTKCKTCKLTKNRPVNILFSRSDIMFLTSFEWSSAK